MPTTVLTYIVRRLIGAVILLFIVSAVVFSIFFLIPRAAGKSAGVEQSHQTAVKLGFTDPIYVQYGRFAKGVVVGQDYNYGPAVEHCPAPCLGYSFITQNPVLPDLLDRLPVTLSLAAGASVLWLVGGQ